MRNVKDIIEYAIISGLADINGMPYKTIASMDETVIAGMISDQFRQFASMRKAWSELQLSIDRLMKIKPVIGE